MFETRQQHATQEDRIDAARSALIGAQNDRFRTSWGCDPAIPGRIVMTPGVAALGFAARGRIVATVRTYTGFRAHNDPCGTRDFGTFSVTVDGREIPLCWKIDLQDWTYEHGSDDAADPRRTSVSSRALRA